MFPAALSPRLPFDSAARMQPVSAVAERGECCDAVSGADAAVGRAGGCHAVTLYHACSSVFEVRVRTSLLHLHILQHTWCMPPATRQQSFFTPWLQGGGLPICYVWLDWLRATALETIGAGRALRLDTIAAAAGVTGSSKPVLAKAQLQQQAQPPPPDAAPPAPLPQAASRREVEQQRGRHAGHQRSRQGGAASTPAAAAAAAPAVALANGMLNPQARSWAPSPAAGRAAEAAVDASPAVDKAAGSAAEGAAAAGGSSGRSSPGGDGGGGPAAARSPDELCMQLMLYDAAHSYRLFRQVGIEKSCAPFFSVPAPAPRSLRTILLRSKPVLLMPRLMPC